MKTTWSRVLLLALIASLALGLVFASTAHAQDDDDDDGVPASTQEGNDIPADPKVDVADSGDEDEPDTLPDEEEALEEGVSGVTARTTFLSGKDDTFPAGEWVDTLLTFENTDETAAYTVRFAAAHINQVGDPNGYIQNFTGNTYDRVVEPHESATFKYRFKPHESLDPRDYNLVLRLFFVTANNETMAIAAYNTSITIVEPLGTDPQTVMTFITILGIVGGAIYYFTNNKKKASPFAPSPKAAASSNVEMGSADSFNKDYVSADHLRYQEALARKNSGSPKRSSSKGTK